MIIVKAELTAKPGNETILEKFLTDMVEKVKQEKNTKTYSLHKSLENPAKYFLFEQYPNKEAFEEHLATPYFAQLVQDIENLIIKAADIETYQIVKTL